LSFEFAAAKVELFYNFTPPQALNSAKTTKEAQRTIIFAIRKQK
jgi:hypothetical protein